MKIRKYLAGAAGIIVATTWVVAFIVVPHASWSPTVASSLLLLSASLGLLVYWPFRLGKRGARSDASAIGAIGPVGILISVLPLAGAISVALAMLGWSRAAWVVIVMAIALLGVGAAVLNAASEIVSNVADRTAAPSIRSVWLQDLQAIAAGLTEGTLRSSSEALVEKVRFAASTDRLEGGGVESEISAEVERLKQAVARNDESAIQAHMRNTAALLDQRELFLMTARRKL